MIQALTTTEQKAINAGASCPKKYLDEAYVRLMYGNGQNK